MWVIRIGNFKNQPETFFSNNSRYPDFSHWNIQNILVQTSFHFSIKNSVNYTIPIFIYFHLHRYSHTFPIGTRQVRHGQMKYLSVNMC
jgi:hypothetical protein